MVEFKEVPLFKLSDSQNLVLFLIKKELQGTKFINELNKLGFDSSIYTTDLGGVILSLVGFNNRSDEVYDWYYELLGSYTSKVNLKDNESIQELVLGFYSELLIKLKQFDI